MHSNKKKYGLVNRLASNLVILYQAHRVAWLIGQLGGFDSNVTKLVANLLTKKYVFIILPIVSCNLVSIRIIIIYVNIIIIINGHYCTTN